LVGRKRKGVTVNKL
jgi:glycylpeptide N-tetradecanoyltransferase